MQYQEHPPLIMSEASLRKCWTVWTLWRWFWWLPPVCWHLSYCTIWIISILQNDAGNWQRLKCLDFMIWKWQNMYTERIYCWRLLVPLWGRYSASICMRILLLPSRQRCSCLSVVRTFRAIFMRLLLHSASRFLSTGWCTTDWKK